MSQYGTAIIFGSFVAPTMLFVAGPVQSWLMMGLMQLGVVSSILSTAGALLSYLSTNALAQSKSHATMSYLQALLSWIAGRLSVTPSYNRSWPLTDTPQT